MFSEWFIGKRLAFFLKSVTRSVTRIVILSRRDGSYSRAVDTPQKRRSQGHPSAFCSLMAVVMSIVILPASIFWIVLMFRSVSSASFS